LEQIHCNVSFTPCHSIVGRKQKERLVDLILNDFFPWVQEESSSESESSSSDDSSDDSSSSSDSDDDKPIKKKVIKKKAETPKPKPSKGKSATGTAGGSSSTRKDTVKDWLIERILVRWWYHMEWPPNPRPEVEVPEGYIEMKQYPYMFIHEQSGKVINKRDTEETTPPCHKR